MKKEPLVYIALFMTSLIYAPLLTWWKRKDPISFSDHTWFQVVIGVFYVGVWLKPLMRPPDWEKMVKGFVLASIPIIARSLFINACNNHKVKTFNGGGE